jgi:hypothetical protein
MIRKGRINIRNGSRSKLIRQQPGLAGSIRIDGIIHLQKIALNGFLAKFVNQ